MSEAPELLPCPACNGDDPDECPTCNARAMRKCLEAGADLVIDMRDSGGGEWVIPGYDAIEALDAWNTRADLVPKVKPLPFEEYEHTGSHVDGYETRLRALTRCQNFFIDRRLRDGLYVVRYRYLGSEQSISETEEGAVTLANAENERRILSALETETET